MIQLNGTLLLFLYLLLTLILILWTNISSMNCLKKNKNIGNNNFDDIKKINDT